MPVYEYVCQDCKTKFEALRLMRDADSTILCQKCGSNHTKRQLSMFFAQSSGHSIASESSSACSGCSGGSCSSCRH